MQDLTLTFAECEPSHECFQKSAIRTWESLLRCVGKTSPRHYNDNAYCIGYERDECD